MNPLLSSRASQPSPHRDVPATEDEKLWDTGTFWHGCPEAITLASIQLHLLSLYILEENNPFAHFPFLFLYRCITLLPSVPRHVETMDQQRQHHLGAGYKGKFLGLTPGHETTI